jgi:hypothetical protein
MDFDFAVSVFISSNTFNGRRPLAHNCEAVARFRNSTGYANIKKTFAALNFPVYPPTYSAEKTLAEPRFDRPWAQKCVIAIHIKRCLRRYYLTKRMNNPAGRRCPGSETIAKRIPFHDFSSARQARQ